MRIDGLDKLTRALDRFATRPAVMDTVNPALVAAGEEIRSHLVRYPRPPRYPLRWASRKQRFYVLFVLRKGLGAYQRTTDPMSQRLQASWAVARDAGRVLVGTRATYAPYVQSAQAQQPFHADTGWTTDEQAVQRVIESGALQDNILRVIDKTFAR